MGTLTLSRYKDPRILSDTMALWRTSFDKHLRRREQAWPERAVNIAMDILLLYEKETGKSIDFNFMRKVRNLRSVLDNFKLKSKFNATSKIKYLKTFKELISFLVLDVSSPEADDNEGTDDENKRRSDLEKMNHEFITYFDVFVKSRGLDIAASKQRSSKKLVAESEISDIIEDARKRLFRVLEEDMARGLNHYSIKDAQDVRDDLILVAASRLGQRSKETMKMTITEVEERVRLLMFYRV